MGLRDYFHDNKSSSAAIAKERLQILVAHERSARNRPDYLPKLQAELLEVICKYVEVGQDAITVHMEQSDNQEFLELNIVLPEIVSKKRR